MSWEQQLFFINIMQNYIKEQLQQKVTPRLYQHIIGVSETAKALATHYSVDEEQCYLAGLMHDYAKQDHLTYDMIKKQDRYPYLETAPAVWHGYVASYIANDQFNINNQETLDAIKFHTTSNINLSDIGKVLYIADTIEPNRDFPEIEELRKFEPTLEEHYRKVLLHSVKYLEEKGIEIGPLTKLAIDEVNNK